MRLAGGGARVLLADKARFPRDKPCGGGGHRARTSPRTVRRGRPPSSRTSIASSCESATAGRVARRSTSPLVRMTQRATARRASRPPGRGRGRGLPGRRLRFPGSSWAGRRHREAPAPPAFALRTSSARTGRTGSSRAPLQAGMGSGCGVALEGNVGVVGSRTRAVRRYRLGRARRRAGRLRLGLPEGRSCEPRGRRLVGRGPRLRLHLTRLAHVHGVEPSSLRDVRGHRLPMRRPGAPAASGRVLLVGDAAGLVDPLSGDGIYEAFVSARLAADAVPRRERRRLRSGARGRARSPRPDVLEGEAGRGSLPARVPVGAPRSRRVRRRRGAAPR